MFRSKKLPKRLETPVIVNQKIDLNKIKMSPNFLAVMQKNPSLNFITESNCREQCAALNALEPQKMIETAFKNIYNTTNLVLMEWSECVILYMVTEKKYIPNRWVECLKLASEHIWSKKLNSILLAPLLIKNRRKKESYSKHHNLKFNYDCESMWLMDDIVIDTDKIKLYTKPTDEYSILEPNVSFNKINFVQ
jgi:hypothetical protein